MKNYMTVAIVAILLALIGLVPPIVPARANALSSPALVCRQWSGTATTTPQTITLTSTSGLKVGQTASVQIANDETAGGSRLWVSFSSTASDPGTAFAESNTFEVKAAERFNIDGRFDRVSIRTASSTAAIRIIASF